MSAGAPLYARAAVRVPKVLASDSERLQAKIDKVEEQLRSIAQDQQEKELVLSHLTEEQQRQPENQKALQEQHRILTEGLQRLNERKEKCSRSLETYQTLFRQLADRGEQPLLPNLPRDSCNLLNKIGTLGGLVRPRNGGARYGLTAAHAVMTVPEFEDYQGGASSHPP